MHKLADIFVASFEISFEEQLSMLDSVDVKMRLSKATELVDRHLQVPGLGFVHFRVLYNYASLFCFPCVVDSCSREDYAKG